MQKIFIGLAGLALALLGGGAANAEDAVKIGVIISYSGQFGEAAIAAHVPDLVAARIDRIDRAGKLIAAQVLERAQCPASGRIAGADDDDVARVEQRRDLGLRDLQ